ncbi:transcription factor S-II-domain-containing protein [Mycena haematopus]|nr:transcription factor S-II-domain-containing protein [Mycena haematopus]
MLFCPSCANLLTISDASDGFNKWICQTCPYQFPITKQHTSRTHLKTKRAGDIRDVLQELEDGASRTEVECQKCGHGFAYFNQLQIRSADEPMTIFYKCVSCGTVRREN